MDVSSSRPLVRGTYYLLQPDKVFITDDPAGGKWTAGSKTGFGDQPMVRSIP